MSTTYLECVQGTSSKFWRGSVSGDQMTIQYGKIGTPGVTQIKDFPSDAAAQAFLAKQEAAKLKKGYSAAADPADGSSGGGGTKKRAPAKAKAKPKPKPKAAAAGGGKRKAAAAPTATKAAASKKAATKKVNLGGHASSDNDLAVDKGVAGFDAKLFSNAEVYGDLHAKLVLIEPAINSDKFFVVQCLTAKATKRSKPSYYRWTRWGRTGQGGQGMMDGPFSDADEAEDLFAAKFKEKTGYTWDDRDKAAGKAKKNKYEYVPLDASAVSGAGDGVWQYELRNDPMGKPDGWYDYDPDNSEAVEELYHDLLQSKASLTVRFVTASSSSFTYRVDLGQMQQQNTSSGTTRPIRRVSQQASS